MTEYNARTEYENIMTTIGTMGGKLNLILASYGMMSLADCDWNMIKTLSERGKATSAFNVGDEKTITLTTGEEVTLQILGFNHDDLADGSGKAGITFGMKNLLAGRGRMNFENANAGGWESSAMRTSTMTTLLSQLPSDLQSAIKQVSKKATTGSQSTTITTSTDKLFLFSEVELGATTTGYASEGEQYEYWRTRKMNLFYTDNDRAKKLSNGTGSAYAYWLRSPYIGDSTSFRCILNNGDVSYYNAHWKDAYGVCFGFCV